VKIDLEAMNKIASTHIQRKRTIEGVEMILDFKLTSRFDLKYLVVQLATLNQASYAVRLLT